MPKILYILNIAKKVNNFSYTSMIAAKELGFDFHIAGNWSYASDEERIADEEKYGIKIYQIDFIRTPYHPANKKAYDQLKTLVEKESYDIIHCNTPIGGVLGRLIGKKCGVPKIIYQAHGFHFFNGAPLPNWLIYYPIERFLARYTDALITINHEDFHRAPRFHLKRGGSFYYIPGVGIDTEAFSPDNEVRAQKRAELGIDDNDIMLISSGALLPSKNFVTAINSIAATNDNRLHLFICGEGPQRDKLASLSKELNISQQIHLLGYRTDIKELLLASDIFLFTSLREGLSRSVMEAMASGLPCVVSDIRGNIDLIENGKGGFLCQYSDVSAFAEAIKLLSNDSALREVMKFENLNKIKKFDISAVISDTKLVYSGIMKGL